MKNNDIYDPLMLTLEVLKNDVLKSNKMSVLNQYRLKFGLEKLLTDRKPNELDGDLLIKVLEQVRVFEQKYNKVDFGASIMVDTLKFVCTNNGSLCFTKKSYFDEARLTLIIKCNNKDFSKVLLKYVKSNNDIIEFYQNDKPLDIKQTIIEMFLTSNISSNKDITNDLETTGNSKNDNKEMDDSDF